MANPKELTELITLVAQGDRRAGDRLFRNYLLGTIEGQVRRLQGGAPVQEREDMAQQMSLWLAKDLEKVCRNFKPNSGSPVGFLRRVVQRCAYRYLRKGKAQMRQHVELGREGDEVEQLLSTKATGLQTRECNDLSTALEDFLADRSTTLRETLELSMNGLTPREIASELNLAPNTVEARLSRLKRALLVYLKERGFILLIATFLTFWLALMAPSFSHAEAIPMSPTFTSIKGAP